MGENGTRTRSFIGCQCVPTPKSPIRTTGFVKAKKIRFLKYFSFTPLSCHSILSISQPHIVHSLQFAARSKQSVLSV